MKYDNLSSDQFWDLIYAVAKSKAKRKKEWKVLLSPEYADVVRNLAEAHVKRLDAEILDISKGAQLSDSRDLQSMRKAREFIDRIRKSALRAIENHRAQNKNIRYYERVEVLQEYIAYLKDTIEDLHAEYVGFDVQGEPFTFYVTVADMNQDRETSIDEWIIRRIERRKKGINHNEVQEAK